MLDSTSMAIDACVEMLVAAVRSIAPAAHPRF
jgi:hypothetical protein